MWRQTLWPKHRLWLGVTTSFLARPVARLSVMRNLAAALGCRTLHVAARFLLSAVLNCKLCIALNLGNACCSSQAAPLPLKVLIACCFVHLLLAAVVHLLLRCLCSCPEVHGICKQLAEVGYSQKASRNVLWRHARLDAASVTVARGVGAQSTRGSP